VSGLVVACGLPVLGFSDCWPTTAFRLRSRRDDGLRIPHEAVVSMMLQLGDHDWESDSYYEWAPTRTLYLLLAGLLLALAAVALSVAAEERSLAATSHV
jgi:hypothetical protein